MEFGALNASSLKDTSPAEAPVGRPAPARLAVVEITLTAFRNYPRLRLRLDSRPVVLAGANGAGKTNLLEAVSFLGAGRGLRGARLADVDCRNGTRAESPWAVAAVLEGVEGRIEVGTGRDAEAAVSRRIVRVDGRPQGGPAALAPLVPVLWLTPAQDRLFVDAPSARRRFLDNLVAVLDPSHAARLGDYDRALRERARLLKEGGADDAWLAALERTMAETGIAIAAARRHAAADLTRAAESGSGRFPAAAIAATGEAEDWLGEGPALAAEDRLAEALAQSRARDADSGGAGHGPHRTDMTVRDARLGLDAASLSTGEQKTLLLSLILAAVRRHGNLRGFMPILLLDEVAAHLDSRHREALYDDVTALGAQAWMTGTDPALFSPMEGAASIFRVADGRVEAAAPEAGGAEAQGNQ